MSYSKVEEYPAPGYEEEHSKQRDRRDSMFNLGASMAKANRKYYGVLMRGNHDRFIGNKALVDADAVFKVFVFDHASMRVHALEAARKKNRDTEWTIVFMSLHKKDFRKSELDNAIEIESHQDFLKYLDEMSQCGWWGNI